MRPSAGRHGADRHGQLFGGPPAWLEARTCRRGAISVCRLGISVCRGYRRLLGVLWLPQPRRVACGHAESCGARPCGLSRHGWLTDRSDFGRLSGSFGRSTSRAGLRGGRPFPVARLGSGLTKQRSINHCVLTLCSMRSMRPWESVPAKPSGNGGGRRGRRRGGIVSGIGSRAPGFGQDGMRPGGLWAEAGRRAGASAPHLEIGGRRSCAPPASHAASGGRPRVSSHRPNATPRPIFATPDAFLRHHAS